MRRSVILLAFLLASCGWYYPCSPYYSPYCPVAPYAPSGIYPLSEAVRSPLAWGADFPPGVYPGSYGYPTCVFYEPYVGIQAFTGTCQENITYPPVGMVPCEGVSCGYGDCMLQCWGRLF